MRDRAIGIKRTFIVCALMFVLTTIHAQKNIGIGILLSPSIERKVWNGDKWIDFKNKLSFNIGVKVRYRVNLSVEIETGLEINDKGSWFQAFLINPAVPDTQMVKTTDHILYLGVPVELRYLKRLAPGLDLTFQSGFIVGRKVWDYEIDKINGEKFYYLDRYSSTSRWYYGFRIGMGLRKELTKRLTVELQPNYTRQLNRGWDKSTIADNSGRYDSYMLKLILWYNKAHGS